MLKFEELSIGSEVVCLNGEGWAGFEKGETYTVVEIWDGGITLSGGEPSDDVASEYFDDFEIVVDNSH